MSTIRWMTMIGFLLFGIVSCATAPKTAEGRRDLEARADATLHTMIQKDLGLRDVLNSAEGYVVFPEIGKGGVIVGAAYGRGVLYERGQKIGFVELNQGSIGAQLGAQTFAELIVFQDRNEMEKLTGGHFKLGAGISAIALTTGAAAAADFTAGTAVFVMPRGGLMVDVSVSGQQLNFRSRG